MGKQGDVYPTWFWVSYIFKGTWKIRKWGNTSPICLHLLFFYTRLYIWTSSLYRRFVSAGPNLSRLVVEPRENTTQITYIHVYIYIYQVWPILQALQARNSCLWPTIEWTAAKLSPTEDWQIGPQHRQMWRNCVLLKMAHSPIEFVDSPIENKQNMFSHNCVRLPNEWVKHCEEISLRCGVF